MKTNTTIQLYPLFRVALCLMAGILVGDALSQEVSSLVWLCLSVSVLFITVFAVWLFRRRSILQSLLLFLVVFLLGAYSISIRETRLTGQLPAVPMSYQAVVLTPPVENGKVARCDLLVLDGDHPFKVKASFLRDTITSKHRQLRVGDGIAAISLLSPPKNFHPDSRFNYKRWMFVHDYRATTLLYPDEWGRRVVSLSRLSLRQRASLYALKLRHQFILSWMTTDDQSAAVLAAMTLGDKSALSKQTRDDYAASGVAHVLALSGLHLTIIYGMLLVLLYRLPYKEIAALPVIWTYVVLVGMSASVMRAATMLTVYAFVSLLHRDKQSLNTLALAAIILLMLNPLSLFDVGFQLSIASVFGILLIRTSSHNVLWQMIVVSFAAQVFTAPLVAYYFGRLPVYFLLANLVVVPAVTILLYSAFVAVICSFLGISLFQYFHQAVEWLNAFVAWVAALPFSSIDNIRMNLIQLVSAYLLIGAVYALWHRLRRIKKMPSAV